MCGLKVKHLYTYVQRKQVIVGENELVDDGDQVNQLFLEKMRAKVRKPALPLPEKEITPTGKPRAPLKEEPEDEDDEEDQTLLKISREKGNLDLMQRRNALELQKIEIQKKRGELVPTDSVLNLVVLHSESIKTAYVDASEKLILIIAARHQMDSAELTEVRNKFLTIINGAVDQSIDNSKKFLKSIVKEYSVKRGVGQHD